MIRSIAATLILSLLALPVASFAEDGAATAIDEAALQVDGFDGFHRIPYQQVAIKLSQPGESLDAFVVRIAPIFDEFTARTEWEACGELGVDANGRYALVIGSVQAALSCATSERNVPVGFTPTGQSVHSHPRTKSVRPTFADQEIQRQSGLRGLPYRPVESNKGARDFSPEDIAHGSGYLVAAGRVLYQEGFKTQRTVGKLEHLAPIRNFAQR